MTRLALVAILALSAAAAAQNFPLQGLMFNWDRPQLATGVDLVTRWATTAEHDLTRIDSDDFKDWGRDAQGQTRIQGYLTWLYDTNYGTAESYGLVAYAEDPAVSNTPAVATPLLNIANIPMPPGTAGNIYRVGATFNQPVSFAANSDVFIGLDLPAMVNPNPPYDGIWVGTASRQIPALNLQTFDEPGPRGQVGAGIPFETYLCYVVNGVVRHAAPGASSLQQLAFDVLLANGGVGGVALTQTNQTSNPSSNAPLGTSNFLSGLHPDINGTNPGRADDIGFGVTTHLQQMPVGSPVFVLLAFGPSPLGSTPVNSFPIANNPDSAGNVCIDFTTAATFLAFTAAGQVNTMGEAQLMIPLSASTRAVIAGLAGPLDLWWQGFALDATNVGPTLELRASGCVIQKLK